MNRNLASSVLQTLGNQSSADIPNVFFHCVVPSRTAVSKFPKIGYSVLFVNAIISRYESGLSLVRNLVAISELLYNHWSPCLNFSSNSIATRVSMRRVVASRSEDNAFVISSADCGEDADRSLSKTSNSHAANSALDWGTQRQFSEKYLLGRRFEI